MLLQRGLDYWRGHGASGFVRRCGWLVRRQMLIRGYRFLPLFYRQRIRSLYGVWLTPNFPDATFRLCLCAMYGTQFANWLRAQRSEFAFLDIGANQGLYSLIAAQNPACQSVYAFEPVASSFELLKRNIALNPNAERIAPHPVAIGDGSGQVQMHYKEGHSGVASLRAHYGAEVTTLYDVTMIDAAGLNALVAPSAAGLIIKIDTEGYEDEILQQLRRTHFWPRVTALFIELDEAWHDVPAILAALHAEGFSERFRVAADKAHFDVLLERAAAQ